jgi:hypothetical protein
MTQVAALPAPATRKDPVHLWWKAQLLRKWDAKRRVQVSPVSTAVRVAGSPSLLSPARSRRILENYTVAAHQEKFASCRDRNSARRFILNRPKRFSCCRIRLLDRIGQPLAFARGAPKERYDDRTQNVPTDVRCPRRLHGRGMRR